MKKIYIILSVISLFVFSCNYIDSDNNSDSPYYGKGSYCPISYYNSEDPPFYLDYEYYEYSNRPNIKVVFADGFEFFFNATNIGDYPWSVNVISENSEVVRVGTMKLSFDSNGEIAKVSISVESDNQKIKTHLFALEGTLKKQ